MDKEIISVMQYVLGFLVLVGAAYKLIIELSKEKTKRIEIQAKENSMGKEALMILRNEISELQKAKGEDKIWRERIENIIKQMEITCEFIERRMLGMFPDKKT